MGAFRVAVKQSVFRETPLSEDAFDGEPALVFDSEGDARTWLDEQNEQLPGPGTVTLHAAHPDDASGVDAYLVFRPGGVWTYESA